MKKHSYSFISLLAIGLSVFLLTACGDAKNSTSQKRRNKPSEPIFKKEGELTFLTSGGESITKIDIEIVDQEYEIQQGLMYRSHMADNKGMLFVFPDSQPRSFWMKNTEVSLDIIFVNELMEIVSIQENTTPKSEYSIPSEGNAQYVIEVVAGFCVKYELKAGNKIEFKKL
ncbi:DUF192 domain-containing protein [Rapidithrix thailandica]|uniref:DUF192 domain-containing protein n=1 Tax=Rapidithrix thailandica TaxID=413964 RepID=A0AAW9S3R1_9BACT